MGCGCNNNNWLLILLVILCCTNLTGNDCGCPNANSGCGCCG